MERRRVPLWWWPTAFFAVLVAGYSLRYVILGERAYVPPLADSFRARPLAILAHTLFGPIALVLGAINLLPAMRRGAGWSAHRLVGKVYLVAVFALGGAGLYLAMFAAGVPVSRMGFGLLAIATLGTGAQGYLSIRRRDYHGASRVDATELCADFRGGHAPSLASTVDPRLSRAVSVGIQMGCVGLLGAEPAVGRVDDPKGLASFVRACRRNCREAHRLTEARRGAGFSLTTFRWSLPVAGPMLLCR